MNNKPTHTTRESGQGLVEYALILVLVAVVVVVILTQLGPVIGNVFSRVAAELEGAGQNTCQISHTSFGTETVPGNILDGASNGTWQWNGNNLRHLPSNMIVCNGSSWNGGVTASGDCSPLS